MAIEDTKPVTTGDIKFVRPGSWPEDEKPYVLLYVPTDDMPIANFDFEDVRRVPIHDMRPIMTDLSLEDQGFVVANFESSLHYEDFYDETKLETVLADEIREQMLKYLGAKALYIHECVIRKRSLVPGVTKGYGQPVQEAHTDYTVSYIRRLIKQLTKSDAEEILGRKYQMLNLWKPLRGPLRDWPLAVCDFRTLGKNDLVEVDEVHKEDILESHGVQFSPSQKWYYLSDMEPDEMLVFKAADSERKSAVPHSAFNDPRYPSEQPRESMELRVLVVW